MTDLTKMTDHDRIVEMHTILIGNGREGLCRKVERNTKHIFRIWMTIVAIGVSIGGGVYGIFQAVAALAHTGG